MTDTTKEQGIDWEKKFAEASNKVLTDIMEEFAMYNNPDYLIEVFRGLAAAVRSDILRRAKEKAQSFGYLTAMGNTPYVSLSDLTTLCTEDLTKEEKI